MNGSLTSEIFFSWYCVLVVKNLTAGLFEAPSFSGGSPPPPCLYYLPSPQIGINQRKPPMGKWRGAQPGIYSLDWAKLGILLRFARVLFSLKLLKCQWKNKKEGLWKEQNQAWRILDFSNFLMVKKDFYMLWLHFLQTISTGKIINLHACFHKDISYSLHLTISWTFFFFFF